MSKPIITLHNVSFSAQNSLIVNDVSFEFEEGKTTALVGPSGGGKSTVLKLSAGLLVPTQGEACFQGKPIVSMNRTQTLLYRKESAFVFQDSALWANQTLVQILDLPLKIHYPKMLREERDIRIKKILATVGYKKSILVRPAMLSTGEQKLIAFARALLCEPTLLYLDEWTESLDDVSATLLVDLVKEFQAKKNTVIFVSHDIDIIKNLSDYIVLIKNGKISSVVTGEQIQKNKILAGVVENGIA
jgi:ABC-type glutathione transport system ATPase component